MVRSGSTTIQILMQARRKLFLRNITGKVTATLSHSYRASLVRYGDLEFRPKHLYIWRWLETQVITHYPSLICVKTEFSLGY